MTQRSQNLTTVKYKNKLTCSQSGKATAEPVAVPWGAEAPPWQERTGPPPQARLCRAGLCPAPPSTGPQEVASTHPVLLAVSQRALHGPQRQRGHWGRSCFRLWSHVATRPRVTREGPTGRLGQQLLLVCAREPVRASDPEQMLPGGRLWRPPPPANGSSVDRTPRGSEAGW